MQERTQGRRAATTLSLVLLVLGASPAPAMAGWWGGRIEFKLGWPPISFEKVTAGETPAKVGALVEASLTREAWDRTAPQVRGIATGDSRAAIETLLGMKTHEVALPDGGSRKIRIADGYIDALSTPRRMEFGYVQDHVVLQKWTVFLDESGRVEETEVFPVGRNEELLAEPRLEEDASGGPPISAYALDYRLGLLRGYPFLSETGWKHAREPLHRVRPGDARLDVALAVDGRYYLYGVDAWFLANGFLPKASSYDAARNRETLAFGWEQAGAPVVKARVILEGDRVSEVRFEGESP